MSIDANTTQQQIVGKYLDNLGYDHSGSVAQCKLFIQACRALLVMHPSTWSASSQSISFDPRVWQQQLSEAQAWLNANTQSAGSVKHLAFGDFR
jgi:hypothetical protein